MAEGGLTPQFRALPGGGVLGVAEGVALPLRPDDGPWRREGDALRGPLPEPPAPRPRLPELALPARKARRTGLSALHLSLGGVALALPADLAERVCPMPPLRPLPGAPPGVLGLAEAGAAPVLVLDTAAAAGLPALPFDEAPAELVVLVHQGQRFGLPAARVEAGPAIPAIAAFRAWLEGPDGAACLRLAPPALPPATAAREVRRALLTFTAGGQEGALLADAVVAALPPTRCLPTPHPGLRGLALHRGDILPVVDAGPRLGGAPTPPGPVPLIRLAVAPPVLLAVSAIQGVREVEPRLLLPAGRALVACALLGGAPLPVHAAATLGALPLDAAP